MCFVIMELFTNLSPNGTTEHFPISRESKNNTYGNKLVTNFYTDQNLNMYIITLKVFGDYLKVSIGVLW
jgi:hypothetical protein